MCHFVHTVNVHSLLDVVLYIATFHRVHSDALLNYRLWYWTSDCPTAFSVLFLCACWRVWLFFAFVSCVAFRPFTPVDRLHAVSNWCTVTLLIPIFWWLYVCGVTSCYHRCWMCTVCVLCGVCSACLVGGCVSSKLVANWICFQEVKHEINSENSCFLSAHNRLCFVSSLLNIYHCILYEY